MLLSSTDPSSSADDEEALLTLPTRRHHLDLSKKVAPASVSTAIQIVADDADVVAAPSPEKPKRDSQPAAPPIKVLFLDGMRGAACMLVVSHHMKYFAKRNTGAVAVDAFFVLSSFLLTMLLDKKLRGLYNERASRKRWLYALTDYLVRRLLRVYPLFMAVVFLIAFSSDKHKAQWYHVGKTSDFSVWGTLTFVKENRYFIFWTLPLEITYYFLIPLFIMGAIVLQRWWWVPMLPLTGWVLYEGTHVFRSSGLGLRPHISTFVCGSIAAVTYNHIALWIKKTKFEFRWWHQLAIRALQATALLLLISVVFNALVFDWFGPNPFAVKDSDHFVNVHIAVLIVCEMLVPGPFSSVFEWPLLRYAGKISFSMYLLHPRIMSSDFMNHQKNYYTKFFSLWVLVFFWSTVSYHAIENPSQWLAQSIGKKIKALDATEKAKSSQFTTLPGSHVMKA